MRKISVIIALLQLFIANTCVNAFVSHVSRRHFANRIATNAQPLAFKRSPAAVFAAGVRSSAIGSKPELKRKKHAIELLDGPQPDTVAAFVDKHNEAKQIHAALVVMAKIDGQEYGIGFPVGTPVAITRRKGDHFEPIVPGDEDFFDAFQAFSSHLQSYDLELCPTAKVLTLEGELDDEPMSFDQFQDYATRLERAQEEREQQGEAEDNDDNEDAYDDEYEECDEYDDNVDEDDNAVGDRGREHDISSLEVAGFQVEIANASEGSGEEFQVPEELKVDESPEGQAKFKAEYELAASMADESEDLELIATMQWQGTYLHLMRFKELQPIIGRPKKGAGGLVYELLSDDEEAELENAVTEAMMMKANSLPKKSQQQSRSKRRHQTSPMQRTRAERASGRPLPRPQPSIHPRHEQSDLDPY